MLGIGIFNAPVRGHFIHVNRFCVGLRVVMNKLVQSRLVGVSCSSAHFMFSGSYSGALRSMAGSKIISRCRECETPVEGDRFC